MKGLLTAIPRGMRAGLAASLLFALLSGLLLLIPGAAQPAFTRIFIDDILTPERRDWARPLLLAMGLAAAAIAALGGMQRQVFLRQVLKSVIAGSTDFLLRALRLPYTFFVRQHGGEISMRVQYIETVSKTIIEDLAATAISLLAAGLYALIMFQYDATLAALVIVMTLLNLVAMSIGTRSCRSLFTDYVAANGGARATGLQGLQHIEVIKASGWENEFFIRWAGIKARAENIGQRYSFWFIGLRDLPTLLASLSMAAVLGIGALRILDGELSIGMLAAFQALLVAFATPMQQFVASSANFMTMGGYLERIREVTRQPEDPLFSAPKQACIALPGGGMRLSGDFELRNLAFGYVPGEPPLIRDFNLKVAPGTRVALVGASGSGKSTIIRLIARLYQPWSGEIFFDSIPLGQIPGGVFARSVSFVDQDIFIFEGSVRDNLTLWNPGIPEPDLVEAARDAEIFGEISERPGAFNSATLCGGANFSGGQRQRLEIARALATNPTILILDEATSALDAETEERIDQALRRRGMTCLMVAHRLSTIRDADEIIVMDKGAIIERGTHDDLMAAGGHYARLLIT